MPASSSARGIVLKSGPQCLLDAAHFPSIPTAFGRCLSSKRGRIQNFARKKRITLCACIHSVYASYYYATFGLADTAALVRSLIEEVEGGSNDEKLAYSLVP